MQYLKTRWREFILIVMFLSVIATMVGLFIPLYNDDNQEVTLEKIVAPEPPKAPSVEYCEPVKEYILKTDDFLRSRDVVILDLSTFELFKTKETKDKTGYYYRRAGSDKQWYTVFKNK